MKNITSVYLISKNWKIGLFLFFTILSIIYILLNSNEVLGIYAFIIAMTPKFILFFGLIYIAEYIASKNKNVIARTILIPLILIISFSQITIPFDLFISHYINNYFLSLCIMFLPPLIASYILLQKSKLIIQSNIT